ncbi:phospholipase D-like domain-containing protein [Dasania marina]|uniref:phospholipase D-like domain-containing protein n=1 Tax=Dasania marina TaxID=471499 RepID=UPI0030D8247E|tara:strand:- start:34393 stop:35919 length:1527 start_codon:yes stop_codon:yes gene_type:complete
MTITWLILALHSVLATTSILHALLYKKDPRAALGWIAVSVAYPLVGPVLYYLFGINRVKTQAYKLAGKPLFNPFNYERPSARPSTTPQPSPIAELPDLLAENSSLRGLALTSAAVTQRPLLESNSIQPLFNGDNAYQDMLAAINQAQHSVCLSSYIFANDQSGHRFIEALATAQQRGVEVRVLLDGVGELYSFPTAGYHLKRKGIKLVRFLPPKLLPPSVHINLRNHRKLLIVDATVGFTGGMNIGDHHLSQHAAKKPGISDVHFSLQGPIVAQLLETFEEDWAFATGAATSNPTFTNDTVIEIADSDSAKTTQATSALFSAHHNAQSICRVITDGPNEDLGKLAMILTAATALATKRIAIMTPYFLPPAILINSLQTAALRGVDVAIILPAVSNQPLVHWATRNMLWELLQFGVKIYYQPAPFAHSKFMLIDDHYAHIGSANLDPRSLRLNFELIVEIFDQDFVSTMDEHFTTIRQASKEETLENIDHRSFPARVRDATAWLFSPYL